MKYKIYKGQSTWIGCFLLLAVLAQPSCTRDFLEVDPQGQQPEEAFFVTQEDATKAVNAMYGYLRSWNNVAFAPMAVESIPSDEAEKGSVPGDAAFLDNFNFFTMTSTEGQIAGFWSGQYENINLANQVLDNLPNIAMDEGLKNRYLAEAKFIRAYSYFRLVRAFGDVPLRLTTPKSPEEYNIPRTPKAEVYAAIEKDLSEAAAVLPAQYPATDVGRATKGAALALQAKAAMYQTKENPGKWNDVLNLTNQVIALGYQLFPDFEKQFRIENENNVESVFEIQAAYVPGNCDVSNSQYSEVQAAREVNRGGWGFNVPTQALVDSFEAAGDDVRMDATILFRGETTPQGDVIPQTVPNPRYNQKSYVPFTHPTNQECASGSEQNIRVIRFADVLLMNAEALNELGQTAEAQAPATSINAGGPLNRVRLRAGLPQISGLSQDQLRAAIWRERHLELAMENDRFYDVIRQGRGAQVFGPLGFVAGKHEVMPIPQGEIDLSAGLLNQNPGY